MSKKTNITIGVVVLVIVASIIIVQATKKDVMITGPQGEIPVQLETPTTASQQEFPSSSTYTLTDVSSHSSKSDCWTIVNDTVYDVTSWMGQHPGGEVAIMSLCGKDGSADFNGQHAGERRPADELASFKIGTVTQ